MNETRNSNSSINRNASTADPITPNKLNRDRKQSTNSSRRRVHGRNRHDHRQMIDLAESFDGNVKNSFTKYGSNSNGNVNGHKHYSSHSSKSSQHRNKSPQVFWERPHFPHWDPVPNHPTKSHHIVKNSCEMTSLPDNYHNFDETGVSHRNCSNDRSRYDSDGNLSHQRRTKGTKQCPNSQMHLNDMCYTRFYMKPNPIKTCCSCGCQAMTSLLASSPWTSNNVQVRSKFVFVCSFYYSFFSHYLFRFALI